ncbi:MAG: DUF2147 domain-containing protein [Bacteroidetes bacterium]|nr:DUF2147 domain-containing protein [Bacteroidota bacterium]
MKQLILVLSIFIISSVNIANAQDKADDILDTYLTADAKAHVRIYKTTKGKYAGKIVWLKEPLNEAGEPKKDIENPNAELRDRKKMGLVILRNFEFDVKDNEWTGGTIYDSRSGKTYTAYMWFEEDSNQETLNIKGYVMGLTFLGKTSQWRVVKE